MSYGVLLKHADGRVTFSPAASKVQAGISASGAIRLGTAIRASVVRVESVHRAEPARAPVQRSVVAPVYGEIRAQAKRAGARREARKRR